MKWQERSGADSRMTALRVGVGAAFLGLFLGFWHAQVLGHREYLLMAETNSLRVLDVPAPRGLVRDRHGEILADTAPVFHLLLDREKSSDVEAVLARVAEVLGVPVGELLARLRRYDGVPRFRPVPVAENITFPQMAWFAARAMEFPELIVQPVDTRRYPRGTLMAHALGHVGEISKRQLDSGAFADAQQGDVVGQMGVELSYDAMLRGKRGTRRVIVDTHGREVRSLGTLAPEPGNELHLTLDAGLAETFREAFAGRHGAAAAIDPNTGAVLALVSFPAFDPNAFSVRFVGQQWDTLMNDPSHPLQDRSIAGHYAPGSTFKIVNAAAALERGVMTSARTAFCGGGAMFHGQPFACWKEGGHGTMDMYRAMTQSCNVYYYGSGNMVGIDGLAQYASRFGLNERAGIDLPGEKPGTVPSTAWKRERFNEPWYAGETISVAIGQGALAVSPLAQAVMVGTVANGGWRVRPYVVEEVRSPEGHILERRVPAKRSRVLKEETAEFLRKALWGVVNDAGTGGRARVPGVAVCGKTGTVQVVSRKRLRGKDEEEIQTHSWFVGFAPYENPEIAIAVLVEFGGKGSEAATPVAQRVLEKYFKAGGAVAAAEKETKENGPAT